MVGMNVVEPARYQARPQRRQRWPYVVVAVCVLTVTMGAVNYLRPLPSNTVRVSLSVPAPTTPHISWPTTGQAAVAAENYGILASSGSQSPLATASTAKVITALCVLQKDPLVPGELGPLYTVDATDVDIYNNYVEEDGSLVPVTEGEQLSEYQALEALMIPSANNIADSLVRWVFGSQAAYTTYAHQFLRAHGLANTTIGKDASGFDPSTTSTASDLTELGLLALKNPVLMQIAGQVSANLPTVGTVYNYDTVLGKGGITGLKTGNNDSDMGAFIFTSTATIGDKTIPITGAVMGADNLESALQNSVQLAESVQQGLQRVVVTSAGQKAGTVTTAWGAETPLVAAGETQLVRWAATQITLKHTVNDRTMSGQAGSLTAVAGPSSAHTQLALEHPLPGPTFWWRLMRR